MRCLVTLILLLFFILSSTGCQDVAHEKESVETVAENNEVEVIIEGGGSFPEFLVGTWKAKGKSGWQITFDQDGNISSAVISMGRFRVKPGEVTIVPMKMNKKSVIEPGPWLVRYDPDNRELEVDIVLKRIYAKLGDDVLEGKSADIFVGPVSKDGEIWQVVWTSFPDYTAHTDKYPNFDFSADPNERVLKYLVFEKVSPEY